MSDDQAWLRRALQEEAAGHEPDSARILSRVESMTGPLHEEKAGVSRRMRRWRLAVLPAMAVVAIASVAWWVNTGEPSPNAPVAVPALTSPSPTDPAPTAGPEQVPTRGTAKPAQDGASPVPTGVLGVRAQARLDPNSNPYWAQNNLVLAFDRQVKVLAVTVRVARTQGVTSAGTWVSLPADDFAVSAKEEPGALVYRYTLKPGRMIRPGTYTFAVQYNRPKGDAGGRDDTYLVQVAGGRLSGHF